MKIELSKDLSVDAVEYASRANAILGIRDSGKTYTGTKIAEQLYDAGIPFFVFDPIGRWRFLKVPGKNGRGFPVVVAGGAEPDLPLTPDDAPKLIRAAMKSGVSMVIDLYSSWRPKPSQPYYFKYWDLCACGRLQHYEAAKVYVDDPSTQRGPRKTLTAEQGRALAAVMDCLGAKTVGECRRWVAAQLEIEERHAIFSEFDKTECETVMAICGRTA